MKLDHSFVNINAEALLNNFTVIKNIAPDSKILAMLKANAYGHGLVKIAKLLPKADGFGVACLSEAKALREAGLSQKIVLMRGVFNQAETAQACELRLDLVVHHACQVKLLSRKTSNLTLWIKINTGMNRLGFLPAEFDQLFPEISQYHKNLILMTHLAGSEEIENPDNLNQIKKFQAVTNHMNNKSYFKSLMNSGGILNFKEHCSDWIRPGLMLYGVSPLPDKSAADLNLKPVLTWESQLIAAYTLKKNAAAGYNGRYIAKQNMPIGIVGVGYADGYPRHARSGAPLLVNHIETSLIGRVSMDMLAVDLRNVPSAQPGDPVVLWGEGMPVEKVALFTATNAYELLCGLKPRV